MSVSLAMLTRRAATPASAPDPRTSRARHMLGAAAVALAPVLLVLAALVEVDVSDNAAKAAGQIADARGQFLVGEMLFAAGTAALIPGALALASLVRGRGAAWMTTGSCMIALGGGSLALGVWAFGLIGYVGTSKGVPRDGLVAMLDKGSDSPVVGLSWALGIAALLGMIVVAVGLIRARAVPLWQPIVLIVAPVLTFFSGAGVVGALLGLPLLIVLVALAGEVIRADRTAATQRHIDLTATGPAADRADADRMDADRMEQRADVDMPAPREGAESARRRQRGSSLS